MLDPQTNPTPIFADEESELAQGQMGSKWQNYSNYKTYAINYYVLLPLSMHLLAPAAWSSIPNLRESDWRNL